jgi:DNA-binding CsgD family transcriptional regulator
LWAPDLVEAYWRCARTEEAAERLAELDADADATGLPTPRAVAERCRGMLAADTASDAHFAAAAAQHLRAANPFEQARTALCYGETLRRHRRPAQARHQLRDALATFNKLGATPFAQRAAAELSAAGGHPPATTGAPAPLQRLTAQESQVALAVARGLSNPAIAATMFISRKTVEAHLSSVYRKLGLSSRTQLVRHLAEAGLRPHSGGQGAGSSQHNPGSA